MVPLITDAPPPDTAPLDAALSRLASGGPSDGPDRSDGRPGAGSDRGYRWLVVTSATAVRVVAGRVSRLPSAVRVACVGAATARAARNAGWTVQLLPQDESAVGLVAAMPDDAGPVLHPRSDLAAPTLVAGLRARGIDVDDVVAYRTVGTGDAPIVLDPAPDAVLVTSGSVASEVVRRLTPLDAATRIVCIGPRTADETRAAGLPVHAVAPSRSAESLLDTVVALVPTPHPRSGRSS